MSESRKRMRIAVWVRRPFSAFVRWWIRSDPAVEACDRAGERELITSTSRVQRFRQGPLRKRRWRRSVPSSSTSTPRLIGSLPDRWAATRTAVYSIATKEYHLTRQRATKARRTAPDRRTTPTEGTDYRGNPVSAAAAAQLPRAPQLRVVSRTLPSFDQPREAENLLYNGLPQCGSRDNIVRP
jgi:hypothetical protein